jgi:hypothetical protein
MARERDVGNEDAGGPDADGAGPPDDGLDRFVADARSDLAAGARGRQRWLGVQAAEEMSLLGVVWDLAERGAGVSLTTLAGRHHRGVVSGAGADFVCLRPTGAGLLLVPLHAVAAVRPEPGIVVPGDRDPDELTGATDLRGALAELVAERPPVTALTLGSPEPVTGELRSVGLDVVVVAVGRATRDVVYLRLSSLAELSVIVSG